MVTGRSRLPESAPRIGLIEDDAALRRLVVDYLGSHGYVVLAAENAATGRVLARDTSLDLLLLDLSLPDADGLDLAREIREYSAVPLVIVSGRGEEIDRVLGLEFGADDYIDKPFSPRELLARIRAVLRRTNPRAVPVISDLSRRTQPRGYRFNNWSLMLGTRRLTDPTGKSVALTSGEFNLLTAFLTMPNVILTRSQLLQATRVSDDIYERSIDVQVVRLRRKLRDDPHSPKMIQTERGVGYIFTASVATVI